jgi:predicted RNase H-related nuclease YkuK (DUF458 family)
MSAFKSRFKKFGGDYIPDIIEYLKNYLENDPGATITVGCDSVQKRRKTIYAITVMMYNTDVRNGAHVVFYRESHDKVRDNQERLYREAQYVYDIGMYLDSELSEVYQREDLNDYERKRYKFHLMKCNGEYTNLDVHREDGVINALTIQDTDIIDFRLVDLHVDFNPVEGNINERGVSKNKSYFAYKSYVPWLRSVGFRTWSKNESHAATTAADLLLKD